VKRYANIVFFGGNAGRFEEIIPHKIYRAFSAHENPG
jgi:hypothetical protein